MPKNTRFNRGKKRPYRKRVIRPKVTKVSYAVKKYVKRSIAERIEDKLAITQFSLSQITQSSSSALGLVQSLTPAILQGTNDCSRVGNSIRIKRITYKGAIFRSNVSASATPQLSCLVLCRVKNSYDQPTLSDMNLLKYQNTSGGTPSMSGIYSTDLRTMFSPFNKDVFDIKLVKYFKIWNASGTPTPLVNNDFGIYKTFNINLTKIMKKKWTYNNNSTSVPENEGLYAFWFGINIDSTVTWTTALSVDSLVECHYEDA
jgi:hypothetical protein